MLLRGAYSAKYRAAFQEKIDNIKDEERQEFNVKLEKTKELSRDTNRRRRALEERRKNYEAEEERKRREILAQRKKEIQEATEKFQRSNIIRNRKKIKFTERTTPAKTVKHNNTRPVSAKSPKIINGQPYYPSVEEVMALLHADRLDVIENLSNSDNQARDQRDITSDVIETADITAEERIIEQEKLRSEVVGRTEPKLAFGDEGKDITAGVLPTTIRRNSPSGSLSSLDSLDAVPDEELEPMPASDLTGSPLAGIIRRSNKVKRESRVTFNENVTFSDGVVGTLKRKQGAGSVADSSPLPKQRSHYELAEPPYSTTISEDVGNESKPKVKVKGLESSRDSLVFNQYATRQSFSKSNIPMTIAQNYPHVSELATTGVMTYSVASNSRQPGGNNMPTMTVNTAEPKANALHVLPNSPRVNGASHVGHASQAVGSHNSGVSKNNGNEKDYTRNTDNLLQQNNEESVKSKTFMNGSTSIGIREVNKKTYERPASALPFSSINASMLKDSLEMHNNIRVSQSQSNISQGSNQQAQQPRVVSYPNNPGTLRGTSSQSGYISAHAEIPPETPLVPVTKRDFLSKALRSDTNGAPSVLGVNTNTVLDHTRSQLRKEEMAGDGTIMSTINGYYSDVNSIPSVGQVASIGDYTNSAYTLYSQERHTPSNSASLMEQSDSIKLAQNGRAGQTLYDNDFYNQRQAALNGGGMRDNMGSAAHNGKPKSDRTKQNENGDSYNQRHYNAVDSRGIKDNIGSAVHNRATMDVPNYTGITHPNDRLKSSLRKEHQSISRENQGIQRPERTTGENSSAIPTRSRADHNTANNEKCAQNTLGTTNTANQASHRPSQVNGQQNFAARKLTSADELLKSVQENIERISMTPAQQTISRTNSSAVIPTNHDALYKPSTSESRHKRTNSDSGRKPIVSEKATMPTALEKRGGIKSAAIDRERKLSNRKVTNGQKSKLGETKKVNGNPKRFHKTGTEYDSGNGNQRSVISTGYGGGQNSNHEMANPNAEKHLSTYTSSSRVHSAHPNQVYTNPNHKTDYHSPTYPNGNRLYGVPPGDRGLPPGPSWTNTVERKQRINSNGLQFLDKTPTDEEINTLWETVRTCLKHEQPPKAASDSVVNNVRYSRSNSGPLVGNHYLIDGNAWASKPNGVGTASDSETRYSRGTTGTQFRRQGSLDSIRRRGSAESAGCIPPRKGLLQHRSHTSGRKITPGNSQTGRPPVNPQYLHSLRGPITSSRGPQKSNTAKTEEPKRPQLSYAEFQAVMQASADVKSRQTKGDGQKNARQGIHQPIIMNYRKEPSALSLEEKKLLESLDRLNERLKVQEAFAGKIVKSPRNGNVQTNVKISSPKFSQSSGSSSRFGSTRSAHDKVPTNTYGLLNRR